MIQKAYKYRLYPNQAQREYFAKTFGCVRFVYNRLRAEKIAYYEETGKSLSVTPAKYKEEFQFLKEVDSLALANAQMNLQSAYRNFFRDKSVGFPKYKSKKENHRSYTTNNQKGSVAIVGNYIKLPKIGCVRVKQHKKFVGTIKSVTVSQVPSGKYYVSLLVETEHTELSHTDKNVGLDLGIKDLCITSDGYKYENPKILKKYELTRQLEYKSEWNNRQYIKIDTFFASSQLCGMCG